MNISRFVNKESDLDFVRTYIYHPVDHGFVIEPRIIVISFSSNLIIAITCPILS